MIITRTAMRISFFGGGTDYPVWYREYGRYVLSTTIDKSCYITTRWLPPFSSTIAASPTRRSKTSVTTPRSNIVRARSHAGNCVDIDTPGRYQSAQETLANVEIGETFFLSAG